MGQREAFLTVLLTLMLYLIEGEFVPRPSFRRGDSVQRVFCRAAFCPGWLCLGEIFFVRFTFTTLTVQRTLAPPSE